MNKLYQSSIVIISVITILMVTSIMLLLKSEMLTLERRGLHYYNNYLQDKFYLTKTLKIDENESCQKEKTHTIKIKFKFITYRFNCQATRFFLKKISTNYIHFTELGLWLNITPYKDKLYYISSLDELPYSSLSEPKVVIASNEINGKLDNKFYGIIITNYLFNVTGKKIYGALYSSFDNEKVSQKNIIYKKSVLDNLDKSFLHWEYLPYSRNILENE